MSASQDGGVKHQYVMHMDPVCVAIDVLGVVATCL